MKVDTITVTETFYQDVRSGAADLRLRIERVGLSQEAALTQADAALGALGALDRTVTVLPAGDDGTRGCLISALLLASLIAAGVLYTYGLVWWMAALPLLGAALIVGVIALLSKRLRARAFMIKLRCEDAAHVERALDHVDRHPQLRLIGVDWRYTLATDDKLTWVRTCIARANDRARVIADALGVTLCGVHAYEERYLEPQNSYSSPPPPQSSAPLPPKSRRIAFGGGGGGGVVMPASLPPRFGAATRSGVQVVIDYRVRGYDPSAAASEQARAAAPAPASAPTPAPAPPDA